MEEDGLDLEQLERVLASEPIKAGFLIPSYHNPTGLVMAPEKRLEVLEVFSHYQVPIIEDGFNEELRYSGSHVAPLLALAGRGNNVVYRQFLQDSLSGLRLGWVMGDAELIAVLESVKRSMNIHTTFLIKPPLEYLQNGSLRNTRRARKLYRQRHETRSGWLRP